MRIKATRKQELRIVRLYRGLEAMRDISRDMDLPMNVVTGVLHRRISKDELADLNIRVRRRASNHFCLYSYISNSVKNLSSRGMVKEDIAEKLEIGVNRVERILRCI